MMILSARFALIVVAIVTPGLAAEGNYLYRAEMVQAAPGKFTELVDLYARQASLSKLTGDAPAFVMRSRSTSIATSSIMPRVLTFPRRNSRPPPALQVTAVPTRLGHSCGRLSPTTTTRWRSASTHLRKSNFGRAPQIDLATTTFSQVQLLCF